VRDTFILNVTDVFRADESVLSASFPEHSLRITEPEPFCDSVKQHSGYLDVKGGKHFFFWYFEARNDPDNAPLVMWCALSVYRAQNT
jgi:hypothetical protein